LVFHKLLSNMYPEYERLFEKIKQTIEQNQQNNKCPTQSSSVIIKPALYQCFQMSEILSITENGTVHIRDLKTSKIFEQEISYVAKLTGSEAKLNFFDVEHILAENEQNSNEKSTHNKNNSLEINPYTYECLSIENTYALGPLAGDNLIRFLQGGAVACAASLYKKLQKQRKHSSTVCSAAAAAADAVGESSLMRIGSRKSLVMLSSIS